ncbi:MAG: family acetyltransferase [Chitinophagaceae bacterium]|jgi:GNAT superfamily N-acetyltransferase|nr:family acetyltransferase [Chitinophagaceae bacterium]
MQVITGRSPHHNSHLLIMAAVEIEIYTEGYKDDVARLILGIQNNEFNISITLAQQPDLEEIPGFYQVGNGNFWIAKLGEKLVGTIALKDIGDKQGALRKMFVDRDHRGKEWSTAEKLLDTLLDWSRQKGLAEIFLGTTAQFLAAQRFYEKNGFVEIEKKALPGTFPVMEVDTKFYKYTLPR